MSALSLRLALLVQLSTFCLGQECDKSGEWFCNGECIDKLQSCNGTCPKYHYLCENDQANDNRTTCKWDGACNGQCLDPDRTINLPFRDSCDDECQGKHSSILVTHQCHKNISFSKWKLPQRTPDVPRSMYSSLDALSRQVSIF